MEGRGGVLFLGASEEASRSAAKTAGFLFGRARTCAAAGKGVGLLSAVPPCRPHLLVSVLLPRMGVSLGGQKIGVGT